MELVEQQPGSPDAWGEAFAAFHARFAPFFSRREVRERSARYLRGLLGPVERKKLIGTLNLKDGAYFVEARGQEYHVLFASVTYFKAQPGDQVTMVIPDEGDAEWAAIEAVIG